MNKIAILTLLLCLPGITFPMVGPTIRAGQRCFPSTVRTFSTGGKQQSWWNRAKEGSRNWSSRNPLLTKTAAAGARVGRSAAIAAISGYTLYHQYHKGLPEDPYKRDKELARSWFKYTWD